MTDITHTSAAYNDDDLVYVDPDTKTVVGKVEFLKNDKPKSLPYKPVVREAPETKDVKTKGPRNKDRGQFWRKFYPFGTYRSMKRIYKLEGKIREAEPEKTLEEVLPKALSEAFWTWSTTEKKTATPTERTGSAS